MSEAKYTISGTEGGKATKHATEKEKPLSKRKSGRMELSKYREERTKHEIHISDLKIMLFI